MSEGFRELKWTCPLCSYELWYNPLAITIKVFTIQGVKYGRKDRVKLPTKTIYK